MIGRMIELGPLVALVGRPNVGKSTLFNRLTAGRRALVDNRPGVTRDRLFGSGEHDGRVMRFVDTGGFDSDPPDSNDSLLTQMRQQTQLAIDEADLILLILDGADGVRPADREVAQLLRKSGKPLLALVNKIDDPVHDDRLIDFYELGLDPLVPISAEHGRGFGDLIDQLIARLDPPEATEADADAGQQPVAEDEPKDGSRIEWGGGPIRVAVVGKPNVGKSSLINHLLGEQRLLATEVPGTTRDPIDTAFERDGQQFIFVDTAGIRRRRSIADRIERFAVMAAMRSIERADIVLIVLDGAERPSDQDARIACIAHELGKGIVLVANKWDLCEDLEWREQYPKAVRVDLPFASYAPLVRLSAKTGKNTHKLLGPVVDAQRERHRRVSTGELNRFFKAVVGRHPPSVFKGKRPLIYFVSQPLVRPPTFVFATKWPNNIPDTYARYLRNQLRARFGFGGTPIWLKFRARGKQKLKTRGKSLDK